MYTHVVNNCTQEQSPTHAEYLNRVFELFEKKICFFYIAPPVLCSILRGECGFLSYSYQ